MLSFFSIAILNYFSIVHISFHFIFFHLQCMNELKNKKTAHSFLIFLGCNAIIIRCKCLNICQLHTHIHTSICMETCQLWTDNVENLIKNFHFAIHILRTALEKFTMYTQNGSWCQLDWIASTNSERVYVAISSSKSAIKFCVDCIALFNQFRCSREFKLKMVYETFWCGAVYDISHLVCLHEINRNPGCYSLTRKKSSS